MSEIDSSADQDAGPSQDLLQSIADNMARIGSRLDQLENTVAGSPKSVPMFNVNVAGRFGVLSCKPEVLGKGNLSCSPEILDLVS